MRAPYTHVDHFLRVHAAALDRRVIERQSVCVVKRGIRYCACILSAWTTPSGVDCWTVEAEIPESCRFTVPCRQVFLCSCLGAENVGAPRSGDGPVLASKGVTCL